MTSQLEVPSVTYHAYKFTHRRHFPISNSSYKFILQILLLGEIVVQYSPTPYTIKILIKILILPPARPFERSCRVFFQSWYAVISTSRRSISNILKAPKAKNPNPSGLGRAIINRRAKDARQTEGSGLVRSSRISFATLQPCLLVHNRHRFILSFAICYSGKRSGRFLEYGTISRHRIYRR